MPPLTDQFEPPNVPPNPALLVSAANSKGKGVVARSTRKVLDADEYLPVQCPGIGPCDAPCIGRIGTKEGVDTRSTGDAPDVSYASGGHRYAGGAK